MLVLYKELKTFDQLEEYINKSIINQVFSNVAISCAIHDQQLDEKMDIANKTTTNVLAFDFCKQQGVGKYFKGNQDRFNQFQVISSVKEHFSLYRAVYDLLEDEVSKENFFALVMFLLCPYTSRFFAGRLEEKITPDYPWVSHGQLRQKREELESRTKEFSVTLGVNLVDFVEIPLWIKKIHPSAGFRLELYSGGSQVYFPVLLVDVKKKRVETQEVPLETTSNETEKEIPEETGTWLQSQEVTEEKSQDVKPDEKQEKNQVEKTEETKEDIQEKTEEKQEKKQEEEQKQEQIEEKIKEKLEITPDDVSAVLASLPKASKARAVAVKKKPSTEEEKRLVARVDLESLQKSIEMLSTMEELVVYLHKQYPTEDPMCADLLNSMLSGVQSIRSALKKHELEF